VSELVEELEGGQAEEAAEPEEDATEAVETTRKLPRKSPKQKTRRNQPTRSR
jgi:hypothetical protein